MLPFDALALFPDAPQFFADWGLLIAAAFALAGGETAPVLAAFLAGIGILPLPLVFAAAWIPALAHDLAWHFAAKAWPASDFIRGQLRAPLLAAHRTGLPEKGAALFFYRLFPGAKNRFPVREALAPALPSGARAAAFLLGTLLWAAAAAAAGLAMAEAALAWTGSRASVWLRLPGFLVLGAVIFPFLRYILWYEWEKLQGKRASR